MNLIEKKEYELTFVTETNESLMNAIRRYVNHVPVLAVDEVEIVKNDSPLYDETIAHRFGLLPLKMKGVKKGEVSLKLSTSKEGYVYSDDVKGETEVVYKKAPITYLTNGQELELSATAILGKGIEHAKFSPGMIFYRNVAEVGVDKEIGEKIKSTVPNVEMKIKGDKTIIVDNKKQTVLDACENFCAETGKVPEVVFQEELVVTVESFGQLNPEEILKEAVGELKKDLDEFSKKLGKD